MFVGRDVHKKTIAVATVEALAAADVRFYGTIANTPVAIRSLLGKLAKGGQRRHLAYVAGPMAYTLNGSRPTWHRCDVVAPSLVPRKVGDKVKTDRRDAMTLAQTPRAGQLTEVWGSSANSQGRLGKQAFVILRGRAYRSGPCHDAWPQSSTRRRQPL